MRVDYETVAKILHRLLQNNVIYAPGLNSIWVNDLAIAVVAELNGVQEVEDRVGAVAEAKRKLQQEYLIAQAGLEDEVASIQRSCPHLSWREETVDQIRTIYCRACGAILEQETTP